MAAGAGGLLCSFAFYLILARILEDRTYEYDYYEGKYSKDASLFLIRGSDRVFERFDAVELWSTSGYDSRHKGFVPGQPIHYLKRNGRYLHSLDIKSVFIFTLLRCGDVHPHPGPRSDTSQGPLENKNVTKKQPKFPCVSCGKGVIKSSKAVECDNCSRWTHIRCSGYITDELYHDLVSSSGQNFIFICS